MECSARHVRALLKKELKDFGKNLNVMFMCVLPLLFAWLYSMIYNDAFPKADLLVMCVGMSLTLVTCFVIAMLIAEEKEKQTLRTLMLSAISPLEFFLGKGLFTLLVSTILNSLIFFIIGIETRVYGLFLIVTVLVCLSMVAIGAIIGLVAPNQMATGVVGMPILLVFLMVPMFAEMNAVMGKIAWLLPNYHMNVLIRQMIESGGIGSDGLQRIGGIVLWIFISAGIFALIYRRNGLDD
ncbi:ABC transporter permease [Gorillibacterium timonense]|uniref:ABC transporter permease n=1 Tax=Gorillibacterium timonense TaxID=1689269 RepID=UPI00071E1B28|nr:ABC transporter permease [Gorillibacterium timonense]